MILWYFGVQDTLNGIYLTRLSYITQIYAMFAEKPLYYFDFSFFYIFISSIYFVTVANDAELIIKKSP